MAAVNLLPLSSLPHLLYNKQCNSFKLFPFKVGTMPSFPSRRCWKDTPEGRGFLESPAGARERVEKCGDKDVCWCLPLPMAPAASPVQPCGLGLALTCLQPPRVETRAPAQRPRMHMQHPLQPPRSPPQPAHRPGRPQGRPQRTTPPPTDTASELRRPRPHWCPPTSPVSCRRVHASCLHPRASPVVCPTTPDELQSDSTSQLLWYPVAKPQFRQWGLTPFQVHPSSQS